MRPTLACAGVSGSSNILGGGPYARNCVVTRCLGPVPPAYRASLKHPGRRLQPGDVSRAGARGADGSGKLIHARPGGHLQDDEGRVRAEGGTFGLREGSRMRTETGPRLVLTEAFSPVSRCCHTKNSEGSTGASVYHVMSRSVGTMHMFRKQSDFEAFERVMVEAHLRQPARWNGRRTGRPALALLSPRRN